VQKDTRDDPLPDGARARLGTLRFRVDRLIAPAALSADGNVLATATARGMDLMDTTTGKRLRTLATAPNILTSLAFASGGKVLASADHGGIRLWDVAAGRLVRGLESPSEPLFMVSPLRFSGDGKVLAIARWQPARPGDVLVWDVASGKQTRHLNLVHNAHIQVWLSPDGRRLATSGMMMGQLALPTEAARTVQLWDLDSGKELARPKLAPDAMSVSAGAFSRDGKELAVATFSGILICDAATGKQRRRVNLLQSGQAVVFLAYAPDGKRLAAATAGGLVDVWDAATGKVLAMTEGPHGVPVGLAFPGTGKLVACVLEGQAVSLWEVQTGTLLTPPVHGHTGPVSALTFAGGGKAIVSADLNGTVCEWEAATGKRLGVVALQDTQADASRGLIPPYTALAVSPGGAYVAAAGTMDGGIRLWRMHSAGVLRHLDAGNLSDAALTFSEDGTRLAAAGSAKVVYVWDTRRGQETRRLPVPEGGAIPAGGGSASHLTFSPGGRYLALGTASFDGGRLAWDARLHLWQLAAGTERWQQRTTKDSFRALAFSPDGRLLATAGAYTTVALWGTAKGRLRRRLPDPGGAVGHLTFSPDGRMLAGAAEDPKTGARHVCVWEATTGQVRLRFRGYTGSVDCLAFAPDCSVLATGSSDTTILLWDLLGRSSHKKDTTPTGLTEPARAWDDLASEDAAQAYRAMQAMIASPAAAVRLLQERLHPAQGKALTPEAVRKLIGDLADRRLKVRDAAARELEQQGTGAVPVLRAALKSNPSLEVQRRLEKLLDRAEDPIRSPEDVRTWRAVEVLERIGTGPARELLAALAGGGPGAVVTEQARAALRRLKDRR
jgi:WD40 repeat protein